ncbi:MAG: hypothetical protein Kow0092_39490 [Deferrisomatales bacterium]
METIWVLGAGTFGRHAARTLSNMDGTRRLLLVDRDEEPLRRVPPQEGDTERADAVAFLAAGLEGSDRPDWIVPAVPIHLAARWCQARLGPGSLERHPVPEAVARALPNPLRAAPDELYVSHATFRCPPGCEEPRDTCTVTGRPRPANLFELLGQLRVAPFRSLVVRSHQLGPGVGGYRPAQLLDLLEEVRRTRGPLLVSTACRCHGVVTGLVRR